MRIIGRLIPVEVARSVRFYLVLQFGAGAKSYTPKAITSRRPHASSSALARVARISARMVIVIAVMPSRIVVYVELTPATNTMRNLMAISMEERGGGGWSQIFATGII